jgi:hypothetical protein
VDRLLYVLKLIESGRPIVQLVVAIFPCIGFPSHLFRLIAYPIDIQETVESADSLPIRSCYIWKGADIVSENKRMKYGFFLF